MTAPALPNALLVRGLTGQPPPEELERLAAAGERPRAIYVEVARALDAEIIDLNFVERRGGRLARLVARRIGIIEGQVLTAFARRAHYRKIVAFADRLGLELALLCKLARSRDDLALVSSRLVTRSKRPYLKTLRVQTQIETIISYSSVQLDLAAEQYGLRRDELHLVLQPVDERFWEPTADEPENLISAVGCISGLRDYPTLLEAVRGLDVSVELAVGSFIVSPKHNRGRRRLFETNVPAETVPPNVTYRFDLPYRELRSLYARSKFVVLPLYDVDFDAGVTSITEAMAMGKAVIATRARGQVDVLHDGIEGLYVPPGDPAALRTAIVHLLEHPEEAERMGAAGRAAVLERHRLDDYARRIAELVLHTSDTNKAPAAT
jgi:glycosyltransferase involved in cell wall biosynthesis